MKFENFEGPCSAVSTPTSASTYSLESFDEIHKINTYASLGRKEPKSKMKSWTTYFCTAQIFVFQQQCVQRFCHLICPKFIFRKMHLLCLILMTFRECFQYFLQRSSLCATLMLREEFAPFSIFSQTWPFWRVMPKKKRGKKGEHFFRECSMLYIFQKMENSRDICRNFCQNLWDSPEISETG